MILGPVTLIHHLTIMATSAIPGLEAGLVAVAAMNRPGFCGGSQSTGEWDDGSSTEVSGRAA